MLKINFKISRFNISGEDIPEDIADKILHNHIIPLQSVRNSLGIAIWASEKSGYRSVIWEKNHGRNGNSQHCFKTKGAVDLTCANFAFNKDKLLDAIIKYTDYTRIAVYDTFIHCDYKAKRRILYSSNSQSKWTFTRYIKASERVTSSL